MASPNRSGSVSPDDQGRRSVPLPALDSIKQCGGDLDLLQLLAASCGLSLPSSDPEDPNGWDPTTDEHMDQTEADAQRLEAEVAALGDDESDERITRLFADAWKLIPGARGAAMFRRYIGSVPEVDRPRFRQIGAEAYRLALEEMIGAAALDAEQSTNEIVAEVRHQNHMMLSTVASSLAAERKRRRWRRSAAWSIRVPMAQRAVRPHAAQSHRGPSRQARSSRRRSARAGPSRRSDSGEPPGAASSRRRADPHLGEGHRGAGAVSGRSRFQVAHEALLYLTARELVGLIDIALRRRAIFLTKRRTP